jgi:hypothetical protein
MQDGFSGGGPPEKTYNSRLCNELGTAYRDGALCAPLCLRSRKLQFCFFFPDQIAHQGREPRVGMVEGVDLAIASHLARVLRDGARRGYGRLPRLLAANASHQRPGSAGRITACIAASAERMQPATFVPPAIEGTSRTSSPSWKAYVGPPRKRMSSSLT